MKLLDCRIIVSETDVFALADEWRALQERIGKSMFTDYDWFEVWWRTLGRLEERSLHIVVGYRDGKLAGLLPLSVLSRKNFRRLQYIGAEAFSQCDVLCENDVDAAALWQAAYRSPHYDFAHVRDVYAASASIAALSAFARLRGEDKNYTLRIEWPTADAWKASLSKQFRRTLDRGMRYLQERGAVHYELRHTVPIPDGVVEDMVRHKAAWCAERGLEGMFDQPNVLPFFQQTIDNAAKRGKLAMAWLTCGEAVVAWHLMFCYGKTIYSHTMAVNSAWLKASPGHLAHAHSIAWAIENGYTLFDHLQGNFAYKYSFSNDIRICPEYTFSRTFKGWVGEIMFITRLALRRKLKKRKKKKETA